MYASKSMELKTNSLGTGALGLYRQMAMRSVPSKKYPLNYICDMVQRLSLVYYYTTIIHHYTAKLEFIYKHATIFTAQNLTCWRNRHIPHCQI